MNTDSRPQVAHVHQLIQNLDRQDWAAVEALVHPEVRSHVGPMEMDLQAWLAMGKAFYAAFPDARHEVQDTIADGDRVVVRSRWRGTQRGAFQGLPATGRSATMSVITIDRVVDGRIVEHWGLFDVASLMQQLGVGPGA